MPRSILPTLALIPFMGILTVCQQIPAVEPAKSVDQVRELADKLKASVQEGVQAADPDIKEKAQNVPTINAPARDAVDPADKKHLVDDIRKYSDDFARQKLFYSRLALGFIIAAAVTALLAAILSFAQQNFIAGIVSIVAGAIVTFSNLYPASAIADFYSGVDAQAQALLIDTELRVPFTVEAYNSASTQLQALILYLQQRPGFLTGKTSTEELAKQMQAIRTASDVKHETASIH